MGCHCLLQIDYILIAYIAIYVYTDILVKDDDNKLEIITPLPHPLEKAMAPHSSTLAWKIPWTEEPGRLLSMGSLRVGYN